MTYLVKLFQAVLSRDLSLAWRHRGELLNPLFFMILVTSLFPVGVGPVPELLSRISGGTIWVVALLATLIALDLLFRADVEDGSLEQMILSPAPLGLVVLAKVLSHWLVTGLPLILIAPLMAIFLNLPDAAMATLVKSLLLGTPVLSLIGSIGVSLTLAVKRGGMLLSLLVLPLYVPILIFGTIAVERASMGMSSSSPLYLMAAMLVLSLTLAPLTAAWALKITLD